MVEEDKVETVYINLDKGAKFTFEDVDKKMYKTDAPRYDDFKKDLLEADVTVKEQEDSIFSSLLPLLWDIGIIVAIAHSGGAAELEPNEPAVP
jgi:hypothetical protein